MIDYMKTLERLRSLVRVTLSRDEDEAVGFAEGSIAMTARHRLVATATVDALRQLDPAAECIDIDHAQIVRVGQLDVAVVTVVFVMPPNEQVVAGSAIVLAFFIVDTLRNDPGTFVAIAVMIGLAVVLDAVWKRARDRTAGASS